MINWGISLVPMVNGIYFCAMIVTTKPSRKYLLEH